MARYSDLPKLGRVLLPNSQTPYALVDVDGRLMLAPEYNATGQYSVGDYVVYGDSLYKCKTAIPAGGETWNSSHWDSVTIGGELESLARAISGGIHFKGYTTTSLYDGCSTNPIIINSSSYTAAAGDLVILEPSAYSVNTAITKGEYRTHGTPAILYQATDDISIVENTSFEAIESKLRVAGNKPEFIWDGDHWSELGSLDPRGLGALAYKDSASGKYTEVTGVTVSVPTVSPTAQYLDIETTNNTANVVSSYTLNQSNLVTTSITGVDPTNTESASRITATAAIDVATTDTKVEDVPLTFNSSQFNTDAIKAVSCSTSFATEGVTVAVTDTDMLTFSTGNTTTPSFTYTNATKANAYTGVATKTDIVPAKSNGQVYGIAGGTVTSVTGLALKSSSGTTVATGSVDSTGTGATIGTSMTAGTQVSVLKDSTTIKTAQSGDVSVVTNVAVGSTTATGNLSTSQSDVTVR